MPPRELGYDRSRLDRLRHGAVVVTARPAVFRLEGRGALTCLQGLLTSDLDKPGDHSLTYGALLTPKGAIVVDYWVFREPGEFTLVAPPESRAASLDLFRRQVPPRLARITDLTDEVQVAWLLGSQGFAALARSAIKPVPDTAGRTAVVEYPGGRLLLGLAPETALFAAVALGPEAVVGRFVQTLAGAGVAEGTAEDLEAARILAGWPALGAEIDDRTLPQEVRYDQLGGVSYTKGCYVGQETVARLHFRGHTNRELRGLIWRGAAPLEGDAVTAAGRPVGSVRSTLVLDDRLLGLAPIRREVTTGEEVEAGGRRARVVGLPFAAEDLDG
ncbi:MAG: YgfZ/GcvT domain-containing protein [Deltaproteobacteria bacterium]